MKKGISTVLEVTIWVAGFLFAAGFILWLNGKFSFDVLSWASSVNPLKIIGKG